MDSSVASTVILGARRVLEEAWNPQARCCFPHRFAYPHQWLWDSCFHSIAWSHFADPRAVVELRSLFDGQLKNGFLPHIRYSSPSATRGPLADRSSFTQPPIHAHALRKMLDAGLDPGPTLIADVGRALEHLWTQRRATNGLIYTVHPWETGTDDSPRWDSWVGIDAWNIDQLAGHDAALVDRTSFDSFGAATWSTTFVSCPASFNALTAWAFAEYAAASGDTTWSARSTELAANIDRLMWNDAEGLWNDVAVIGGGASVAIPTVDGLLPILVSADARRAQVALDQLIDTSRFAAAFGTTYLLQTDPLFLPDVYWRGPAWPQLEYLLWLAALRWDRSDVADSLATAALDGVLRARFAEYWNPLDGQGHGGKPQTWSAVMAVVAGHYSHD